MVAATSMKNPEARQPFGGNSLFRLLFSWLWVCLPLGWGIWQTAIKSLPLFDSFLRSVKP